MNATQFTNCRLWSQSRYLAGPYGFACKVLAVRADGRAMMVRAAGSRRIIATGELWPSREDAIAAWTCKVRVAKQDRPAPYPARKPVDVFAMRLAQLPADSGDVERVAA